MADVPISNALIDSAQFQVQSVAPAIPDTGLVRLFRGTVEWSERRDDGSIFPMGGVPNVISKVVPVDAARLATVADTPVQVLPGVAGRLYNIISFVVLGDGGTAYTTGAGLNVVYDAENAPIRNLDSVLSATPPHIGAVSDSFVAYLNGYTNPDLVGSGVSVVATTNYTGGTRGLKVYVVAVVADV